MGQQSGPEAASGAIGVAGDSGLDAPSVTDSAVSAPTSLTDASGADDRSILDLLEEDEDAEDTPPVKAVIGGKRVCGPKITRAMEILMHTGKWGEVRQSRCHVTTDTA